jgi:hypothetical protein
MSVYSYRSLIGVGGVEHDHIVQRIYLISSTSLIQGSRVRPM